MKKITQTEQIVQSLVAAGQITSPFAPLKSGAGAIPVGSIPISKLQPGDDGQFLETVGTVVEWVSLNPVTPDQVIQQTYVYGVDSGTADNYVVTVVGANPNGYGAAVEFIVLNTNTGPSVISINEIGPFILLKYGGGALAAGDIVAGQVIRVIAVPGSCRVENPIPPTTPPATITLSGDVTGSGTTAITTTLKNTGTPGTYTKVTFDAQGRETSGTTLSAGDIPNIAISQVTGLATQLYTPLLDTQQARQQAQPFRRAYSGPIPNFYNATRFV